MSIQAIVQMDKVQLSPLCPKRMGFLLQLRSAGSLPVGAACIDNLMKISPSCFLYVDEALRG